MVAAVGLFTLMDTIAKYLSRWYPVPGIVWARYALNLVILLGWLAWRGELKRIRTQRPGIQLAREGRLRTLAVLSNTDHPGEKSELRATEEAARTLGPVADE